MSILLIILTVVVVVFIILWLAGNSFKKMLTKMENEAEDAYWILDKFKKKIDEAEPYEEKSNSSN